MSWWILSIGFLAQIFFSARTIIQWILSEKEKKVLSPSLFWIFSICGAYLLCLYGFLRDDFSIVLGQFITYYIYLWNLNAKGIFRRLPLIVKIILFYTPIAVFIYFCIRSELIIEMFFKNENIPMWMIAIGVTGQLVFTFRFVYQFFYSRKQRESLLPKGFWIISIVGAGIIVSYGVLRMDPILLLSQGFGIIVYIRNLIINHKSKAL